MDIGEAFADGIRPNWAPGLNTISKPDFLDVDSWLAKGTYNWLPSPQGSARLGIRGGANEFTSALASEISRFSCAAYESLLDSPPPPIASKSLGWPLVRHYYAIFYCAHALLRISGSSLTYLSSATAAALNHIGGQYLGVSPKIASGLYFVGHEKSDQHIVNLRPVGRDSGGSHEGLWKQFLICLTDIENTIVKSQGQTPSALEAVRISTQLRARLCHHGRSSNGAWPSVVRNSINYRHDYGVWYPYTRTTKQCADLTSRMTKWRPDTQVGVIFGDSNDDLNKFADVCNVITRFLTASLKDIANRSTTMGKSFVDRHPFKLLRIRQVAI